MDGNRLAELVAQKAQQDPRIAKIVQDARQFDELTQHPSWKLLRDYVLSKEEGWMAHLGKMLMRPKTVASDLQRDIDYFRGFYDGAKYAVMIPEVALANLYRVAQRAYALEPDEETDDQDWSPYI